jgi:hypothetical protein
LKVDRNGKKNKNKLNICVKKNKRGLIEIDKSIITKPRVNDCKNEKKVSGWMSVDSGSCLPDA